MCDSHQDAVELWMAFTSPHDIGVEKKNMGIAVCKSWYFERGEQGR